MANNYTYDPMDVNVIVDGTILTGFADGEFVTVEKDEENFTSYVGAKGEVTRAKNANNMGKITVTLKHTSPSNAFLSQLAKRKDAFPANVVDLNADGAANAGGTNCYIEKPANIARGAETGTRQWVIIATDIEING